MKYTIYGSLKFAPTWKLLNVAKIINLEYDFVEVDTEDKCKLVVNDHIVVSCISAIKLFARLRPDLGLYGQTFIESALIDDIFSDTTAVCSIVSNCTKEKCCKVEAHEHITKVLKNKFEAHFLKNTYIVGERLTVADIHVAGCLQYAIASLGDSLLRSLPNSNRWFNLIINSPIIKLKFDECSAKTVCNKNSSKTTDTKATNNKTEAPSEKNDEETETKPSSKPVNPLDLLPESTFILDEWKRKYSNTKDLRGDAMKWFWENIDKAGWSVWYFRYEKEEGENQVDFMAGNLLGGFLQRIDPAFRKYSFGVFNVVGKPKDYDVQGIFLLRGKTLPFELTDHPSFEFFAKRELDFEGDRSLIEDYWCNEDQVENNPIVSCRVWK